MISNNSFWHHPRLQPSILVQKLIKIGLFRRESVTSKQTHFILTLTWSLEPDGPNKADKFL